MGIINPNDILADVLARILEYGRSPLEGVKALVHPLWWRLMPGTTIKISWPYGYLSINDAEPTWSSDPNDFYRPWLEQHVGRQGWDWDWRFEDTGIEAMFTGCDPANLIIKFRKGKEKYVSLFFLTYPVNHENN